VAEPSGIFDPGFLLALEVSIKIHHIIYPAVPPQGIYFEELVEQSFVRIKKPFTHIKGTGATMAGPDLLVEDKRISLKTETGSGTKPDLITITKLCTTERDPWDVPTLVGRVLEHLSRYDIILMLRCVWELPLIHYQLLEIPVENLRLIETAQFALVGPPRSGGRRQSLKAVVCRKDQELFDAFFDASDGKCTIRKLRVADCVMLDEWDIKAGG
jgi:hypothetical protein